MNAQIEVLEADLVRLTLGARDGLPKALNGRPIAPSCDYVIRARKAMQQQQSRDWFRIASVLFTDLQDGVGLERVRLPLRRLDAALVLAAHPSLEPRLRNLSLAEQRTDGALDMDQLRLDNESENDPAFIERLIERCAQQKQSIDRLQRAAELQLVRLRGSTCSPEPTASTSPLVHPSRAACVA